MLVHGRDTLYQGWVLGRLERAGHETLHQRKLNGKTWPSR